jgi:hypothetical protein
VLHLGWLLLHATNIFTTIKKTIAYLASPSRAYPQITHRALLLPLKLSLEGAPLELCPGIFNKYQGQKHLAYFAQQSVTKKEKFYEH